MPEQAVTDTATAPTKVKPGGLGRPLKAAQQAKSRSRRDPLSQVEHDTSLDSAPEYPVEGRVEIPKPPHFRFGTDQPSPRRPEHFFAWWCGLTAKQKAKCLIYVYRNYPVIGIKTPDPKSPTGFRISAQIDKRSGTDVIASLDDILHLYGSGNYTIRLNQDNPNKAVCLCVIQGLRDEQHPPVVELDHLVIDDPANRPYIEGLRLRGVRVPGVDAINEEDQMGSAAVTQMVGTVEKLMDRNAELSARMSHPPQVEKKPTADESIVSTALATGMKIISDASATQSKMLESAMTRATAINAPSQVTPGPDPLAMLEKVGELLKAMAPTPATNSLDKLIADSLQRSQELEKRLHESSSQQMSFLQNMVLKSQESQPAAASTTSVTSTSARRADAGQPPTTPLEMLKEMVKLKEALGNLSGDSGSSDLSSARSNPATPWWGTLLQNLPALVQMGATIASMVAVASYNNAIAKTGAGIPTPVAMPTLPTPDEQQEQSQLDSGELPQPPNDGTTTNLPQPGDATVNAYHIFLSALEKPLRLALENNEPGDQFAEKLVGWQGQVAYDLLHGLGRDQLIHILSTYPPIWSVVSAIPTKFSQFLDEFMSYGDGESAPTNQPPAHQPEPAAPPKSHNPRAGKKNSTVPVTQ